MLGSITRKSLAIAVSNATAMSAAAVDAPRAEAATAAIRKAQPASLEPAAVHRLELNRLVGARIVVGAPGRAPNVVSAKERREISALLEAIFAGTTQLRVDFRRTATSDVFNQPLPAFGPRTTRLVTARMRDDLTRIAQTASGRELLRGLASAEHVTTIVVPGTRDPNLSASCAGPLDAAGQARVYFTPGVSYARDGLYGPSDDPNAQFRPSHVTLFHELGHALAVVTGTRASGQVTDEDNPSEAGRVSLEEYRNIGLGRFSGLALSENVYRAERRAIADAKHGAAPGDERLSPRTNYRGTPPSGRPIPISDPAYVEQLVAMLLDQSTEPVAIAWELVNGIEVDRATAMTELSRQLDAAAVSAVADALAKPRDDLMADYTTWATRRG